MISRIVIYFSSPSCTHHGQATKYEVTFDEGVVEQGGAAGVVVTCQTCGVQTRQSLKHEDIKMELEKKT